MDLATLEATSSSEGPDFTGQGFGEKAFGWSWGGGQAVGAAAARRNPWGRGEKWDSLQAELTTLLIYIL